MLEITETGQGRLHRILALLESCQVSIHDLSRVGQPVRFNMPFELGLACALQHYRHRQRYVYLVLEKEQDRLTHTLSDLGGRDPLAHGGSPFGVITRLLDALGTGQRDPSPRDVHRLYLKLRRVARELEKDHRRDDVFSASVYRKLVAAAVDLAVDAQMVQH